jgi:two-component system, response regulator YesN
MGMSRRRAPEGQGRIREILDIIESQSPQKISQLALEVNLSESRLQHLFKQETGVRLGRLLTEQRLQKAAELLVGTRLRIKEIAAVAGYEHASSFSRAFEQRFAQSPVVYRRNRGANSQ